MTPVRDDAENVEKVKIIDHGLDFKEPADCGEFQPSNETGDVVRPEMAGTEPLWVEAQHSVNRVRSGETPLTDDWAGLRVVASPTAARSSLDAGGVKMAVPPVRTCE